jgi:hypothetical protein
VALTRPAMEDLTPGRKLRVVPEPNRLEHATEGFTSSLSARRLLKYDLSVTGQGTLYGVSGVLMNPPPSAFFRAGGLPTTILGSIFSGGRFAPGRVL